MIQKNINFLLLVMVILATFVNVAAAVFYQSTYGPLDDEQAETAHSLAACENDRQSALLAKQDALAQLDLQQDREEAFADQFVEKAETAESLGEQASQLQSENDILRAKLELAETQLAEAQAKVDERTTTITDMFRQIKNLEDDLKDCEDDN